MDRSYKALSSYSIHYNLEDEGKDNECSVYTVFIFCDTFYLFS